MADPWISADPWSAWASQRRSPHGRLPADGLAASSTSSSRPPALVTVRGPYTMIHDAGLAREFLAPLQAALVAGAQPSAAALTIQAPPGEGWRSRLVAKKGKLKGTEVKQVDVPRVAEPVVGPCPPNSSEDAEVAARFAALEPCLRSQVREQLAGRPTRSSRTLVHRDIHALGNAARHHFEIDASSSFAEVTPSEARSAQRRSSKDGEKPVPVDEPGDELCQRQVPKPTPAAAPTTIEVGTQRFIGEDDFWGVSCGSEGKVMKVDSDSSLLVDWSKTSRYVSNQQCVVLPP